MFWVARPGYSRESFKEDFSQQRRDGDGEGARSRWTQAPPEAGKSRDESLTAPRRTQAAC